MSIMSEEIYHLSSVSQLRNWLGLEHPKHPLLTYINAVDLSIPPEAVGKKLISDFYTISLKDKSCGMDYGRQSFDFQEGVMVFTGPGQVTRMTNSLERGAIEGWMLYIHPDFIKGSHLDGRMSEFHFFDYEVFEALHLSREEEILVGGIAEQIRNEYEQRIDGHSRRVILSSLELLLNYSLRFYDRQFSTRHLQGSTVASRFRLELKSYFDRGEAEINGLPSIAFFAEKAHLSAHYFSDVLKKETGRSAKDHINDFVVDRAKNLLLASNKNVSEIAYDLGFNYPHYFTRFFKSKTGMTPVDYRNKN